MAHYVPPMVRRLICKLVESKTISFLCRSLRRPVAASYFSILDFSPSFDVLDQVCCLLQDLDSSTIVLYAYGHRCRCPVYEPGCCFNCIQSWLSGHNCFGKISFMSLSIGHSWTVLCVPWQVQFCIQFQWLTLCLGFELPILGLNQRCNALRLFVQNGGCDRQYVRAQINA